MFSPWVLTFGLFGLYPFLFSLGASFSSYSPLAPAATRFVGVENYARALADPAFWSALRNTAVFVAGKLVSYAGYFEQLRTEWTVS